MKTERLKEIREDLKMAISKCPPVDDYDEEEESRPHNIGQTMLVHLACKAIPELLDYIEEFINDKPTDEFAEAHRNIEISKVILENLDLKKRMKCMQEVVDAAKSLRNEVNGLLSIGEYAIRQDVGNTNFECVKLALNTTIDALKALEDRYE